MSQITRVHSCRYVAESFTTPNGCFTLVITMPGKRGGVQLIGAEATLWANEIATSIDAGEADDLCRAIWREGRTCA